MDGSSRWDRWGRPPYVVLAVALFLMGVGVRFLTSVSPEVRSLLSLPLVVAGGVLLAGPAWRRIRSSQAEEIRRNPTGKAVPLDDRLANVDHPRARWFMFAFAAVLFGLATLWAIYMAVTRGGAFIGIAIYVFLPVPLFCWLTWRTRALLNRRP